jgi:hypothetical protein
MLFAEDMVKKHKCNSLRLDTYIENKGMISYVEYFGYESRGEIFGTRPKAFVCFEKIIK